MERKRKLEILTMTALEKYQLSLVVSRFQDGLAYWAGTGEIINDDKCILCILFHCNRQCLNKLMAKLELRSLIYISIRVII